MRKLVVSTFLTLDGVMQAPGGPEEDPSSGFKYGGWSVNYWDDTMNQVMTEVMAVPSDYVLGRKTYEIFAAYWPQSKEEGADILNNARKYVASRTLKEVTWQNSTLLKGDAVQAIKQLKEENGPDLLVQGSSDLLQSLLSHNLVDLFHLWIFPVVVGSGKRLFDQGTLPAGLKLVDTKISTTGVIMTTYVPAGELVTGSF